MQTNTHRHLIALPRGGDEVFLSWRMLEGDGGYALDRRRPGEAWSVVEPVAEATSYVDRTDGGRFEYRVRMNGGTSEIVSVDASAPATNVAMRARLPFENGKQFRLAVTGDVRNDGRAGYVVRYVRADRVRLCALEASGRALWDVDTRIPATGGWNGSAHHVPFLCWDVDADGRTEVVYHEGGDAWPEGEPDASYRGGRPGERLVIADAETGEIKRSAPWPGRCARTMMTVGLFGGAGEPACAVVLDETYGDVTITAVDGATADVAWQVQQGRAAGHNLDVADIDGDGRQEVIAGGVCYDGDGSVRWEAEEFGHTDMSKPADILPDRPGLEIWYNVERGNPGVYLVDKDGATLWKEPYRHAHYGWIAKLTESEPGLQLHCAEDARHEYGAADAGMRGAGHFPVFRGDGSHLIELDDAKRKSLMPVQWEDGPLTVFVDRKRKEIVRLREDGSTETIESLPPGVRLGRNLVHADVVGDHRENIVTIDEDTCELVVLANTRPTASRRPSPMESSYYRHDRSQHGSGYYMYVPPHRVGVE